MNRGDRRWKTKLVATGSLPLTQHLRQSVGDLALYDNRAVQHYGVADYGLLPQPEQGRMLEHIASLGTVPFLDDDDGSRRESVLLPRDAA